MKERKKKITTHLTSQTSGFKEFLMEQRVVSLAVGFVVGAASSQLVSAIVNDIIEPFLSIFIKGEESLAEWSVTILDSVFPLGHLITTLIDFLAILLVAYILLKVLRVDRLDKPKPVPK